MYSNFITSLFMRMTTDPNHHFCGQW